MKRFFLTIMTIFCVSFCFSQDEIKVWESYFTIIPANENSPLILLPNKIFFDADKAKQQLAVNEIMKSRNAQIAFVKYGTNSDLWHRKGEYVNAKLIDKTDLNNVDLQKFTDKRASFLIRNNWFTSYNGILTANSSEVISFAANFRSGTFLFQNRWDAAFSFGMLFADESSSFNIGINSRYYHPIRKLRLSPYVGLGIGNVFNEYMGEFNASFDFIPSLGVSWGLNVGSLDFGLQYGSSSKFMMVLGYTFFPFRTKTTSAAKY